MAPILLGLALVMLVGGPLAFGAICVFSKNEGEKKLRVLDRQVVRLEEGLVVERNRHGKIIGRIDSTR